MQKFLFARIEVWFVLLIGLLGGIGTIFFGAGVLSAALENGHVGRMSHIAMRIAEVPGSVMSLLTDDPMLAVGEGRFEGKSGWSFPKGQAAPSQPGYLLLSRFDGTVQRHVIELVALSDMSIRHRWQTDSATLLAGIDPAKWPLSLGPSWNPATYRAIHPYLTADGGLIFKDHQSFLIKVDACGKKVWRNDDVLFHHSTESDGADGFWIPTLITPHTIEGVKADFLEDGLGHVTAEGKMISNESLAQILIDNGMEALIFSPGPYNADPMHINDIQPVLRDGPYWKAGDLFLSLRPLSMVVLYRPSERKVIWHKIGPWIGQHDIDVLDDHRIAIFNNNAPNRGNASKVRDASVMLIYDFATDTVSAPFGDAMRAAEVRTMSEGLYTQLPDGGLLVEEENAGRVLLFGADHALAAEYVNRAENGKIYHLGWSRYLPADAPGVTAATAASCGNG